MADKITYDINHILSKPFAGDDFVKSAFLKYRDRYKISNAIETGTFKGATTKWLIENFDNVYSCEINEQYAENSNYYIKKNNVIYNTDSYSFIKSISGSLRGESIFF